MIASNFQSIPLQPTQPLEGDTAMSPVNFLYRNIEGKIKNLTVFKSLFRLSMKTRSTVQSIGTGKLISRKMRTKVINWLEKLAFQTFSFQTKTVLLAIKILDQYLCLTNQSPASLQLIGCACLYLAAKATQSSIIASQCYVVASANSFTEEELHSKQFLVFQTLKFDISFLNLTKVYNFMKQTFQCQKLPKYTNKEIELFFLQTSKNIEFLHYRDHQIVSMLIATLEIQDRIPEEKQFLELLKQKSQE